MQRQFTISDYQTREATKDFVTLGSFFAFVHGGLSVKIPWLQTLGLEVEPKVVHLLGTEAYLPGCHTQMTTPEMVGFATVTSDKSLYSPEQSIHLFVYAPTEFHQSIQIVIEKNGDILETREAQLGPFGTTECTLSGLEPGSYRCFMKGTDPETSGCSFSVAVYKLVPLVASFQSQSYSHDLFDFEAKLDSFGFPVEGPVRLELESNGHRLDSVEAIARDGVCRSQFQLTGEGPHCVHFQLLNEPSKTATLPIVGSRRSERTPTTVCEVGSRVLASLLPSGASDTEIRGLYLSKEADNSSPIVLEQVDTRVVNLRVSRLVKDLCVLHVDLMKDRITILGPETVQAEQELSFDVESPLSFVVLGGFEKKDYMSGPVFEPWESWTAILRPSDLDLDLNLPDVVVPGEELVIRHPNPSTQSLYVVVKDSRLASKDTPQAHLAGQMKERIEDFGSDFKSGKEQWLSPSRGQASFGSILDPVAVESVDGDLFAVPAMPVGGDDLFGAVEVEEGWSDEPNLELSLFDAADEFSDYDSGGGWLGEVAEEPALALPVESEAEPSAESQEPKPAPIDKLPPEVVFAGLVEKAEIRIPLPEISSTFRVEAFSCNLFDWAATTRSVQTVMDPYIELLVPPYVNSSDVVNGKVEAGSALGQCKVEVWCDEQIVALNPEGHFQVKPGAYRAKVTDQNGDSAETHQLVSEPGHFLHRAVTTKILTAGTSIKLEEGIESLRILPGIQGTLETLVEATAGYEHLCCEQTAAKMLSAVSMYVLNPDKKAKAESIFVAGARRMESMVVAGDGFSMYPDQGYPCSYWGPLAVRHLLSLEIFRTLVQSQDMTRALEQSVSLAARAATPHNVVFPPIELNNAGDCYWASRLSQNGVVQKAADICRTSWQKFKADSTGRVMQRVTAAYCAATMIRAGHLADAIELVNLVTQSINEQGRLYSTVDSVAAITMMTELNQRGLNPSEMRFVADGQEESTVTEARPIKELSVLSGIVLVEVTRNIKQRWDAEESNAPFKAELVPQDTLKVGSEVVLKASLPEGYKAGDLLWVCLPDALTRLEGGGQVKMFSADFQGKSELTIPLVTTARTNKDGQHFAVCLRNMFEEERVANPGPLKVVVG